MRQNHPDITIDSVSFLSSLLGRHADHTVHSDHSARSCSLPFRRDLWEPAVDPLDLPTVESCSVIK